MAFCSILYEPDHDAASDVRREEPEYFHDLNLDQVVAAITAGREEYDLAPFFHTPLRTVEGIEYRHEVSRDLERPDVFACIGAFARSIRVTREKLSQVKKLYYRHQKQAWFLHAVQTYAAALVELNDCLAKLELASQGLRDLREYVEDYVASERFTGLVAEMENVATGLGVVHYAIQVKAGGLRVRAYQDEPDYTAEVAETFAKFRQGAVKDYRIAFPASPEMNHIEAKVLEFVALLYPQTFAALGAFVERNRDFRDPVVMRFDREVQFYVAYLEFVAKFRSSGLRFCYPVVSPSDKTVRALSSFDLALATKLLQSGGTIVCNDVDLHDRERIAVVSGPNNGGKTTFARTFGQLHHLASLGCMVPGSEAKLFLFDAMFTHFEREETIENLRGKLQDDLIRIREILDRATPLSIIIVNEIFNSTTLSDAVFLARHVVERIAELDALCVCVTFLDELSRSSEKTISVVSTVDPNDPTARTFKVVRRAADGRAYAISVAEKYGLTYGRIKERLRDGEVARQ